MTTTPADLLAAAEEVLSSHDPACDHIWNAYRQCQWCHRDRRDIYVDQLARHILATVHPDDDEPVTVEWLLQNGFVDRTTPIGHRYYVWLDDRPVMMLGMDTKYRWYLNGSRVDGLNPTRGQVRQLLSALNVEVK